MGVTLDAFPRPQSRATQPLPGQVRGETTLMFMQSRGFDAVYVLMASKYL